MSIALRPIRVRTHSWLSTISMVGLPYVLIGLIAFALRAHDLGLFITSDEVNFWLRRSEVFLTAITSGDFAATAISVHPGVTTMWLGAGGILLRRAVEAYSGAGLSFEQNLALMRLPVVLAHVAGLLVSYRMLRRLLPLPVATLAALLWAVDPFVIGYSQLLHVDALAGTFATLSILAALVAWQQEESRTALVISAVAGALAILSKSPALLLLPLISGLALVSAAGAPNDSQRRRAVTRLVVWSALLLVVAVALWPALWSNPAEAIERIRSGVEDEGAQPHMLGNFFLGHEDLAPGALFYPVALALRLTPWTLIGLLAVPFIVGRLSPEQRRTLAAIAAFAVLFIIFMSIFPKKFNRYLVPIFPGVDILAAVGLAAISRAFGRTCDGTHRSRATFLASNVIVFGALLNAIFWQPYSLAAFNQLLGGAQAGAATFMIGWGEGMDQVAAWINQQPDSTGVITATTQRDTLQPYLKHGVQAMTPADDFSAQTGYAVVYVRDAQVRPYPPFDQVYGKLKPIHTVAIHGVTYAWIYQIGPPVGETRPAHFGESLTLRGFTMLNSAQRGQELRLRLFWHTDDAPKRDYALFVHLTGPDGTRYTQVDPLYPTSMWGGNRFVTTEVRLPIPADLPLDNASIVMGMYDPLSGKRLPLEREEADEAASDGDDALKLTDVELPAATQ